MQSLERLTLGRYHLRERIGTGGMGQVYRAIDTNMAIGREVAIKIFPPPQDLNKDKSVIKLFEREVRAITKLNHPHILPIFDYGIEPAYGTQFAYIVMPLCQYSLSAWLQKINNSKLLSLQSIVHFLLQAASALQLAHAHKIIHKDVKPENFLIRENITDPHLPDLLLADFGIAKLHTATVTTGNQAWGTPAYMPPEQWEYKPVPASDQYALAIMIYKVLTGRFPYQSDKQEEMRNPLWMREQHCKLELKPDPPSKHRIDIPTTIDHIVLKALSKKPEDRYSSVNDFAQAFQDAVRSTEKGPDIYLILTISETEALVGTEYPLILPNQREVVVTIPAGAKNGQEFRIEGKGGYSLFGGPNGTLVVTLMLKPANENDQIIKELRNLSQDLATIQSDVKNDQVAKELQRLSQALVALQSKSKNELITKELQRLLQALVALKSDIKTDQIINELQRFSQDLADLQSTSKSEQITIKKNLQTISNTVSAMADTNDQALSAIKAYTIALAATTSQNLHPPYSGILVLNDPLTNNTLGHLWTFSSDCFFLGGAYYVTTNQKLTHTIGLASNTNFSNFAYQVQMRIIIGDAGGIVFRSDGTCKNYLFRVDINGNYYLHCYTDCSSSITLSNGYAPAFNKGLNESNVIAVVSQGTSLYLYINFHFVTRVVDNTHQGGQIGVAAIDMTIPTQVAFSQAKVWAL